MIGIRGIKQVSLAYCPPIMLATTTLSKSFVTMRRMPLHNIGGSRFLRSITELKGKLMGRAARWRE